MKRLGHSSITVTYVTYGHPFPALDEVRTTSMDRSYSAAVTGGGDRDPGNHPAVA